MNMITILLTTGTDLSPIWIAIITSTAAGYVVKSIVDRLFRTKEQKGMDMAELTKQLTDTVSSAYQQIFDAQARQQVESDEKYGKLEKKFDMAIEDRDSWRDIAESSENCELLVDKPQSKCIVSQKRRLYIAKRHAENGQKVTAKS